MTFETGKFCLLSIILLPATYIMLSLVSSTDSEPWFRSPRPLSVKSKTDVERTHTAYDEEPQYRLHKQCTRGNPSGRKHQPMLIFKMARSGSTWLAASADGLPLQSGNTITFQAQIQVCSRKNSTQEQRSDDLITWLIEYFSHVTNGTMLNLNNEHNIKERCLRTVKNDTGMLDNRIASIAPHEVYATLPTISSKGWKKLSRAVPDLAIGVLSRTNTVKHAISGVAMRDESDPCNNAHNVKADNLCARNYSGRTVTVPKPQELLAHAKNLAGTEKRLIDAAARVARMVGDGRLFCLTYENMQRDIAEELAALGDFIGDPIDKGSLDLVMREQPIAKRTSDDLSKYLKNYEQVRGVLSADPCFLKQLEAVEPQNFPNCGETNKTTP